jgi:hypothetical protein
MLRWVHLNTLTCAAFFCRSLVENRFFFESQWKAIGDAVWVDRLLAAGIRMAALPKPLAAVAFTGSNLGASSRAHEETREWQGKSWRRALAPWFSLAHRLRK